MNKEDFVFAARNEDDRLLKLAYENYREKFVGWFMKTYKSLSEDEVVEIYQKGFTILYFKAKKGGLDDIEVQIETYLIGIGKNLAQDFWRRQSKLTHLESIEEHKDLEDYFRILNDDSRDTEVLSKMILQLGEPCGTIIKMFYWKNFSMEVIAQRMGYKNAGVAKKKKYICIKKLKVLMKKL